MLRNNRYLRYIEHNNAWLVWNPLTNGLCKVENNVYESLHEGKYENLAEDIRQQLMQAMFLVDENFDELLFLRGAVFFDAKYNRSDLLFTLMPTYNCNMACPYCFEPWEREEKSRHKIDPGKIFDYVVSNFEAMHPKTVSVSWFGGEPLLDPEYIKNLGGKIKAEALKRNIAHSARIVTNGMLLTNAAVDLLAEVDVQSAQVTLDGPPEVHNKRRFLAGNKMIDTFGIIFNNIKSALEKEKIGIAVRINIDKDNVAFMPDLFQILSTLPQKNLFVGLGQVLPGKHDAMACKEQTCGREFSTTEYARLWTEIIPQGLKHGLNLQPYPMLCMCDGKRMNGLTIDPSGAIFKCWDDVGRPELSIGSVETGINYSSDRMKRLLGGDLYTKKECRECKVLPVCLGGCPRNEEKFPGTDLACMPHNFDIDELLKIQADIESKAYAKRE